MKYIAILDNIKICLIGIVHFVIHPVMSAVFTIVQSAMIALMIMNGKIMAVLKLTALKDSTTVIL